MKRYRIAGLSLRLEAETGAGGLLAPLAAFETQKDGAPDLCAEIVRREGIETPPGGALIDEYVKWSAKSGGGYSVYNLDTPSGELMVLTEADENWRNVRISFNTALPGYSREERETLFNGAAFYMLGLAFRNAVLLHDGFVIHASSIDYDGSGLLFSAPSGTGKSTHINLWEKFYGDKTRVVNDDTPVVRILDGSPFLFGSPWCGSSFRGSNVCVPLRAMVALERGSDDSIRPLGANEVMQKLLPRVFLPYYSESLMDTAVGTFTRVAQKVPSYRLSCTMSRGAVEAVRAWVK